MTIKQQIQNLNNKFDKFDLSKKYPDYFNKVLIRAGFVCMFLLLILFLFIYGFDNYVYVECNNPAGCQNPYLVCSNIEWIKPLECDFYETNPCKGRNCEIMEIDYKDYVGSKPPQVVESSVFIILFPIFIVFLINHILYLYRRQK